MEPRDPNYVAVGEGWGSTVAVATGRGIDQLMAQEYVKTRQPKVMSLSVMVLK